MNESADPQPSRPPGDGPRLSRRRTVGAYAVHVFTACGVLFAFLAAMEACSDQPDARVVFAWLLGQMVIDALDGPLARGLDVKNRAGRIAGRSMDDIIDFLTYTFIPFLLVWRLGWLPGPDLAWIAPALVASLLAFTNTAAKQEEAGFFVGWPSYWNIYAFYAGLWVGFHGMTGQWINAGLLTALTILSLLPVRFVYPNLAPRPWRKVLWIGGVVWVVMMAGLLIQYPRGPHWLVRISLIYPAGYLALSAWLDARDRRNKAEG